MEVLKKSLACWTLLFLVNNLQAESEYIDYCKMTPHACASHTFDISNRDPNDSYSCLITPLQYDNRTESFNISGTEEKVSATKVNETSVRCILTEFQSAEVKLESKQDGIIGQPGFIYPKQCFFCSQRSSCSMRTRAYFSEEYGIGCFIDGMCYPMMVLNPSNSTQMCFMAKPDGSGAWLDVVPSLLGKSELATQGFAITVCELDPSFANNYTRATAPEKAGQEGIDLLAEDAYVRFPHFFFLQSTLALSIKFYVKFGSQPVTKNTTFFELPSALKLQRRPDKNFQVEYTFHDQLANKISKVVIQEDATYKVIANKNNADKRSPFGMKLNVMFEDKWTMIGLGYEMYEGSASVAFYVNGNKVNADVGDLAGLFLYVMQGFEIKNAAFSCFETSYSTQDEEFFTDPNFPKCVEAINWYPAEYYESCGQSVTQEYQMGLG